MRDQQGQSLVEMIVVVGMVVLLTTGIVAGTTMSLSRAQTSQMRSDALVFAQSGLELARKKRDQGWNAFAALGTPATIYCVGSDESFAPSQVPCTAANINTIYTRSVTLTLGIDEVMRVVSSVSWGDQGPLHRIQLTTYLTQWR